jgi:hypothetical protein
MITKYKQSLLALTILLALLHGVILFEQAARRRRANAHAGHDG